MLFFTKKKTRKSFTIAALEATNCLTFITYFPLGEGSIFLDPMIQVVGRENLFTTHFTSCPKPQDDTPRSHLSEENVVLFVLVFEYFVLILMFISLYWKSHRPNPRRKDSISQVSTFSGRRGEAAMTVFGTNANAHF